MNTNSTQSVSLWNATETTLIPGALMKDTHADVCVIGAGIAGMTTAYLLVREGRSVVVLDDGPIAGGETQRTTAHLANAIDNRYVEIERLHGAKGAQLTAESHTAAIDRIDAIVREEQIACEFERLDGYLFDPPEESSDLLERELQAARRAGLTSVELVERAPLKSFDTGPCLRFPRQGQFHPLKYLAGLAGAIQRRGGRIFSGAHATTVKGGAPATVETRGGPVVTSDAVVVATNTPINDRVAIHTKQAPYMTYVIAAQVPSSQIFKALYWDTLDPYHYVRLQPFQSQTNGRAGNPELLIVGGEDHKTGQAHNAGERYFRLETWARARFPMMREIAFRWSGQVMESVDGLAFIGRNPLDDPSVFVATGDSGMGMTHGTIAGILITDLIMGRENPWTALYDPSRKRLRAAGTFTKENLNVAAQYGQWFTGGEIASAYDLEPGTGAVMRRGLSKVAVYRDEQGQIHERSAACPHLGCVVEWNQAEHTWDCPCHGSRFDCYGEVIDGPSNGDLRVVGKATPIREEVLQEH